MDVVGLLESLFDDSLRHPDVKMARIKDSSIAVSSIAFVLMSLTPELIISNLPILFKVFELEHNLTKSN